MKLARSRLTTVGQRLLGDRALGIMEYFRNPDRGNTWGGPFNGQLYRRQMFDSIIDRIKPSAIIETGTYLGNTTEYLAQTGIPVFTIETDRRRYGFSRARFWQKPNVTMRLGDSRSELRALLHGPLRLLKHQTMFAYLDAHGGPDLPLREELDIIFSACPLIVVMVDDFQVPDDLGYGYDNYGPGKVLCADYVTATTTAHKLLAFYPNIPANGESGARRGCIVLVRPGFTAAVLKSLPLLRSADANLGCEKAVS